MPLGWGDSVHGLAFVDTWIIPGFSNGYLLFSAMSSEISRPSADRG